MTIRKPNRGSSEDGVYYRFKIDAYTPATIPMGRLAEYMAQLAILFGERHAVHFNGLTKGSTILNATVDREAAPKVRDRVTRVRAGDAAIEPARAFQVLNHMLRDDNATGLLRDSSARGVILNFPGRELAEEKFASIRQHGTIDGIVTGIRGRDETIHITILSEDRQISGCETTRAIAKQLGLKLFEPVRFFGSGKWTRDADGMWHLQTFRIESFQSLDDAPLADALIALRAVPNDWHEDAYRQLVEERQGAGKNNGRH